MIAKHAFCFRNAAHFMPYLLNGQCKGCKYGLHNIIRSALQYPVFITYSGFILADISFLS